MKLKKPFILIIWLLFLLSKVNTQGPAKWQITDEDGLPNMTVYQVLKDKQGYIWFGTGNGLCRYDGHNIRTFRPIGFNNFEILRLEEDAFGRIWFFNLSNQIAFIDKEDIQLVTFNELPDDEATRDFVVKDSSLWVVRSCHRKEPKFPKGFHILYHFNLKKGDIPYAKSKHPLFKSLKIRDLQKVKESVLFLSKKINQETFIYRIEPNNEIQTVFTAPNYFYPYFFYASPDGRYFMDYKNERKPNKSLFKVFDQEKDLFYTTFPSGFINGFSYFDNRFFLLTQKGIIEYKRDNLLTPLLKNTDCHSIFIDEEANLWLATGQSGVFIIPSINVRHFTAENSILNRDGIEHIIQDPVSKQIFIIENNGNIFTYHQGILQPWIQLQGSGQVNDVFIDKRYLWTSIGGYLYRIDKTNKTVKVSPKNLNAKSISADATDQIWVSHHGGVSKFNFEDAHLISDGSLIRTYKLFKDASGNFWVGNVREAYIFKENQPNIAIKIPNIEQYDVTDIAQTQDSSIWISTSANGVFQLKNHTFVKHYSTQNGLTSNYCKNLFAQGNYLWIGTNAGVNRLDYETEKVFVLNKFDGLPTNEISTIFANDTLVLIGTPRGLVEYPIDEIKTNQYAPPIHILNVEIAGQDTLVTKKYNLSATKNNIKIDFLGLGYRARGNLQYQYRMIGLDSAWISTSTNFVRFQGLNPGDYVFEVKAINEDGYASSESAQIALTILPPWWKIWWVQALGILAIIALGVLLFFWRLRKMRAQEAIERQINDLHFRALQTQMNPHFIFNALNGIQKYFILNDQEKALLYLGKFARLIRLIFEHSKKKYITLTDELEFLKLYLEFEKMLYGAKVQINFEVADNLIEDGDFIQIPPLIIQPIIENAFKHGLMHKIEGGILDITFKAEKDGIKCIIQDNGVGRKRASELGAWRPKEYRSAGLKTTKERLKILAFEQNHQVEPSIIIIDLINQLNQPEGTKIELII